MTYIDPRHKALRHLDRVAAWERGETPAPVTLEWDLSNRCPYGCVDCHFAYTHVKGPWTRDSRSLPVLQDRGGDLADTGLVLSALSQAAQAGVKGVVWTGGGEPTTHPHWLSIALQAKAFGLEQGMYTLGALITQSQAAAVRDAFAWVVISLDALTPAAYVREKRTPASNWQKACEAIRHLSGGPCAVGVSFLLHERNWMQAREMVQLGRALGATYTTLRPTIRTMPAHQAIPEGDRTWVTQALPVLEELSHEPDVEVDPARFAEWRDWTTHPYPTCYGIRLNATVTPDGRMWVCPNRREFGGASCLGDLRTESFTHIWSRHPGQWTDMRDCRAMCRLHPVNQTLAAVYTPRAHEAFI